MDAPADYVVDADDGSGWSFEADMSQLMTNEEMGDEFYISKPPVAINVLLRQIEEKNRRRTIDESLRFWIKQYLGW